MPVEIYPLVNWLKKEMWAGKPDLFTHLKKLIQMGLLEGGKNVSDYGSLVVCGWCGKILVYYSSATRAPMFAYGSWMGL